MQEDLPTNLRMIAVESIAHDVNRRNARSLVVGIDGDALDLPFRLDFQSQTIAAIADDVPDCLLQITLASSNQQQIIHVSQIMLDIVRPLAATQLAEILLDTMIQRLQKEIREPLARIGADGHPARDAVDHLVQDRQNLFVLDDVSECCFQQIMVDMLIEFSDVQLHEILGLIIQPHPFLDGLPRCVDSTAWNAAIGMLIHATHDNIMNGLHEHPMYDMVGKTRAINFPLFPTRRLNNQVAHRRRNPIIAKIGNAFFGIYFDSVWIELSLMLWQIVQIPELPAHHEISALVLRTVVDRRNGIVQ